MKSLPSFYQEHLYKQLTKSQYYILIILISLIAEHRWVRLEELANLFPQPIKFESRRKKLQRFFSLPALNLETIWFPILSKLLSLFFDEQQVVEVIIDRTKWDCINLLMVSCHYNNRAIPIYFELLNKNGSSNLAEQKQVLYKVLDLLNNYKVVVLGDREFCNVDLASWLSSINVYFCLRLRKNEYIEISSDVWKKLRDVGLAPGMSLYFKGVKITKTKGFQGANIACKWKRKYRGWQAEEGWFIITNFVTLDLALKAYENRFGIEEMFRDFKGGGYNIERTGLTGDRLIVLILLITIAYTSAIVMGEKINSSGVGCYVGRVKEAGRSERRHSAFYIGSRGNDWLDSIDFYADIVDELMKLSPAHKIYYARGKRAVTLIRSRS